MKITRTLAAVTVGAGIALTSFCGAVANHVPPSPFFPTPGEHIAHGYEECADPQPACPTPAEQRAYLEEEARRMREAEKCIVAYSGGGLTYMLQQPDPSNPPSPGLPYCG